jgi:ethanolamine ammonia-lyase small subunit
MTGVDKPKSTPVVANPWRGLRRFTSARIALGRAGVSLPTQPQLDFQFAHAQARDAVHTPLDIQGMQAQLTEKGYEVIHLHSAVADRHSYLQRPDLGRRLDQDSRRRLEALAKTSASDAPPPQGCDVSLVVADGLSARAIHENAVPTLDAALPKMQEQGWRISPVALVEQGRVAIGDEIGEVLNAAMVVVLIGERPGLSSPDSLGIYFTYAPRVGLNDSHRNCISNIRPAGLSYEEAAHKLSYLMREAHKRKLSGFSLKDEAEALALQSAESSSGTNFLIEGDPTPDGTALGQN